MHFLCSIRGHLEPRQKTGRSLGNWKIDDALLRPACFVFQKPTGKSPTHFACSVRAHLEPKQKVGRSWGNWEILDALSRPACLEYLFKQFHVCLDGKSSWGSAQNHVQTYTCQGNKEKCDQFDFFLSKPRSNVHLIGNNNYLNNFWFVREETIPELHAEINCTGAHSVVHIELPWSSI